jgi:nitric oxide reductase large subunit
MVWGLPLLNPHFFKKENKMINKILLLIGSALTVACTSFGIWFARQLVTREPICYWEEAMGHNSFNYLDTYMLLLLGIGIGLSIMEVLRELID